MEVLLRYMYGATAVTVVPRRPHCGLAQPADVLNMLKVSAVPSRTSAVLTVFGGATAINDEPLQNHDDHGGATADYVVQAPQWHRAFGVTGVVLRRHGGTC